MVSAPALTIEVAYEQYLKGRRFSKESRTLYYKEIEYLSIRSRWKYSSSHMFHYQDIEYPIIKVARPK
jgi:hypothetical protein